MKKRIGVLLGATVLTAGMLSGCGGSNQPAQDITNQPIETTIVKETTSVQETTNNEITTKVASSNIISEEEAKKIALKDAGVNESDTTGMQIKLEMDDGIQEYEVDFNVGVTEYDYTINATDGKIIEKDADMYD